MNLVKVTSKIEYEKKLKQRRERVREEVVVAVEEE